MTWTASYGGPPNGVTVHVSASHTEEAGQRCALAFNPDAHLPTAKVKGFHAAAMQSVINERDSISKPSAGATAREKEAYGAAMRCFATALTHLEAAQMFAVKGLHAKKNAGV